MYPQNLCVEALIPNVPVAGYRAVREGIQVKWDHKGGALNQ